MSNSENYFLDCSGMVCIVIVNVLTVIKEIHANVYYLIP